MAVVDDRWRAARRILAVRVDNLGDVLMTTPALAALRSNGAQLGLLTSPASAGLAGHVPMVDELLVHDVPWTKGDGSPRAPAGDFELIELLRRGRYDAAVIFTVCTQSALPAALVCRLAGVPLRLAHCRENPYDLLTDWRRDTEVVGPGMRHEVERQLDLVASLGFGVEDDRLRFELRPADRQAVRSRLTEAGIAPDRPFLLVHPGASAPSRRYPAERLGRAARAVVEASGCRVVIVGGASEQAFVAEAATAFGEGAVTLPGRLSLGELGALIAQARLMICNNSGPMHLAAAVGTPVVALYALTNPQHTPWRVPAEVLSHEVPCRDCLKSTCPLPYQACLLDVTTDRVAEAALRLFEATA